ncbi:MAG: hypothetical protein J0I34_06700 [Pseudonocardia sp.]|uniref:hypothetical protein n=1 Tax=unclassified Pseudonocardia TaxID=2619320 RepID=UPI00086EE543|nr:MULTISPECIES: hypothetical protein [unclassified Pseudonocardia]MBN9108453.1 hypothetical protein [Pseudonocardia sp.]ODU23656.1 MAG: hypothetical protein ABS80_14280 [Pseudonocardia sp. SCN 72-51]ODV07886.1 MAG: hypothetical protein ABT15_07425 [Pseudonocardia sp. SCN 73-27]
MRAWGVTYDTGFTNCGSTTHEPFDPEIVGEDMRIIREELLADAVRITGGVADRLEIAARHAAAVGLEVWYCPFTNDLTTDELLEFLLDAAERAERIRRDGADIRFLTGSEISIMTIGLMPGKTLSERSGVLADPLRVREVLPDVQRKTNALLARAVEGARARFGGPIGYASLPMEGVDWTPFDFIATDAGYRDATNAAGLPANLAAMTSQGKPFAITEFGCAPFTGAADRGSRGDIIGYDEQSGRATHLTETVERNEQEQATYLLDLLGVFDSGGVDTAFVYTFASRHLPTSERPERDFDLGSFGIVKVLPDGRTGSTYPRMPWEPKAAFFALAEYGRARRAHPRRDPAPRCC